MAEFAVPRHNAVMERLRRRIALFRRHHAGCESRYVSTGGERRDAERQQTLALHQRCLQTKAKRSSKHRQPAAHSADPAAQRGVDAAAEGASATGEQSRSNTLIALQETVKRKLENAGSPLGREQVNGFTDGYPSNKKACVEDSLGGRNGVTNGSVPPLSPMDTKHNVLANGNHRVVSAEHSDAGLTESAASRGSESDFQLKKMKQEPVDDILPCILPSGGASGNNSLFPDLNLNLDDQDWSEIMEEFNRSVPYEDIQELFSDSFGDRKDPELTSTGAAQSLIPPDLASVKTEFSPATAAFDQDSCNGSPQVRSTSSGPPLHTSSPVTAPATSPALPVPQPVPQPARQLPNHMLPVPPKDLSPAQQLQQLAAREQQRAILQSQQQQHVVQKPPQQKPQQPQAPKFHQQPNHATSWPQNTPSQSQMSGTFGLEKPTSPLYPQDFPNPKTLLMPNKGSPKAGAPAGYMQPGGHANMLSHPAAPTGPLGHPPNPGSQAAMLDYSNTKPLSHYEAGAAGAPRGPPTTQSQNKQSQAILNMMRHTQMQKQRPGMSFRPTHIQHPPDSGSYPSSTHGPGPGNSMTPQPSSSVPAGHSSTAYMKQQQQMQMMSQQQKQFLQRQMMAEQEKQQRQQQEQQLQRHLTRPPPQYQDQQNPQAQQNPFQQQQQQVSQFSGVPPCLAQQHPSSFPEHTISGASQPIGNVSSLSGAAPGAQRMFSQTQGMMGMGVGQSAGPTTGPSPAASQADMSLPSCAGGLDVQQVLYGNMPMHPSHPNQQRAPVSAMSAAYRQNVLAAQQQAHLKNQPNVAMLKQQQQLARLPNSIPNAMANNMGSAMPSSMPTSIQGALPTQAQSWQQQQHPGLQPGSSNVGMPAGFPNSGFHMQSRLSKLPNSAPFSQGGMGNSAAGRSLSGMNPGQMMPNMSQQRTNMPQQLPPPGQQTAQQGQPQVPPQAQQVLPDLGPFSQPQAGPNRTAGLQCNQAYQLNRTANQQLQFSYSTQSGGSLSGFPAETDLVDSLLKSQSTQEWMDDIDELLASHQ